METRRAALTLRSRQIVDGEAETALTEAQGVLSRGEGRWTLSWREPAGAGLGATRSELTVLSGGALLTRTGEVSCKMAFRPGKTTAFFYRTPYAALSLSLTTHSLSHTLGPGGGAISLRYSLTGDGGFHARTELTVEVRILEE